MRPRIFAVILLLLSSGGLFPAYSSTCVGRINQVPDLTQTDPEAKLPDGGGAYCGPAAASNCLMWFVTRGFEKLLPGHAGKKGNQADLARLIGSGKYMDTSYEAGTPPSAMLEGIARYIRDSGYTYKRIQYQGWRKHGAEFSTGVVTPDLEWIKAGFLGNSAAILNVGWYKYDLKKDEYKRVGGHWVSLAGFGVDEEGREDPAILIIHDPGPRAGLAFRNDYVRVQRIDHGTIVGGSGKRVKAAGFYKVGMGRQVKPGSDFALMDGVILIEMDEPCTVAGPGSPQDNKSAGG